jgi:hypothetical protein
LKNCEGLIDEVKKEYELERSITANKLREVSGNKKLPRKKKNFSLLFLDAFGAIYRTDEINNLNDELMAELGRDEKTLEKLGSQDLTPNEVNIKIYFFRKIFYFIQGSNNYK